MLAKSCCLLLMLVFSVVCSAKSIPPDQAPLRSSSRAFILTQSIQELRHIAKSGTQDDFDWCSSNIETWLSSVLTNTGTCLDEFPSHNVITGKTKAIVKAKVVNVAESSSNALALFHKFADKYRSSNRWIKKSP